MLLEELAADASFDPDDYHERNDGKPAGWGLRRRREVQAASRCECCGRKYAIRGHPGAPAVCGYCRAAVKAIRAGAALASAAAAEESAVTS